MAPKKARWVILALVILSYAFMYTQTKDRYLCNDDCQKVNSVNTSLVKTRNYIYYVNRCGGQSPTSDTLCVFVKDTTGINWDLLADTACLVATQNGLYHQKLFICNWDTSTHSMDTLVRKQCQ